MINVEEKLGNCVFIDDFKKLITSLCEERNKLAEAMESRLDEAADILVAAGRIHNTPHSKRQWIDSHRVRTS